MTLMFAKHLIEDKKFLNIFKLEIIEHSFEQVPVKFAVSKLPGSLE